MSLLINPDQTEFQLKDYASAKSLMLEKSPSYAHMLEKWCEWLYQLDGPQSDSWATSIHHSLVLACSRMALRHGSWGSDQLQYHNEKHISIIIDKRIPHLVELDDSHMLNREDWALLALFAACHDLRQREQGRSIDQVGPNERASVAETHRILVQNGLSIKEHDFIFTALDFMISGSTFMLPNQNGSTTAETVGGALAPSLINHQLNNIQLGIDEKNRIAKLSLIAADLDTANVSDPFYYFAKSAQQLCAEREYRSGRNLESPESREAVIDFLGPRQREYFHQLHRFHSALGSAAFSARKLQNEPLLEKLTHDFERLAQENTQLNAQQLMNAFLDMAKHIAC